jgi:hypothetical protein
MDASETCQAGRGRGPTVAVLLTRLFAEFLMLAEFSYCGIWPAGPCCPARIERR